MTWPDKRSGSASGAKGCFPASIFGTALKTASLGFTAARTATRSESYPFAGRIHVSDDVESKCQGACGG
jgi:hypothetical protein